MAATIGVCEDHRDYQLMNLAKQKIRKGENRFIPNKLSFISIYFEHSQALFHTHNSTPIQVAKCARVLLS